MGVLQSAHTVYLVLSGEAIWSWLHLLLWAGAITAKRKHVRSSTWHYCVSEHLTFHHIYTPSKNTIHTKLQSYQWKWRHQGYEAIRVWEDAPWLNKKLKITEIIEKTHKHKSAGDEWAGWGRAHPSPHWCAWQHRCDRISQITFSTLGTLCLGGDYYCHSFNGLAWTSAGSANGVWIPHISIAIRGPARQQQVGDWQMEVAAQQTRSQSKAKQRGANYVRRNRVIHHSVRHLSSHTKETW